MVTLLTDYTTQRYILNSADDIGDLEFRNGDQVLLMDQDVLIIYDEEGSQWYPVPTGGGSTPAPQWMCIPNMTVLSVNSKTTEPNTTKMYFDVPDLKQIGAGVSLTGYTSAWPYDELHVKATQDIALIGGNSAAVASYDHTRVLEVQGSVCHIQTAGMRYKPNLETVDADVYIGSGVTNPLNNCGALKNIRFVPNKTECGTLDLASSSHLTDASVVSIANGLKAGAHTLKFDSTVRTHCASIMGTVSQVTDGENTYDFFTVDAGGTTSLTEFITTTKGWTLS